MTEQGGNIRDYIEQRKKNGMTWDEFRKIKEKYDGPQFTDAALAKYRAKLDAERNEKLKRASNFTGDVDERKKKKSKRETSHKRDKDKRSKDKDGHREKRDDERHRSGDRERGKDRKREKSRERERERDRERGREPQREYGKERNRRNEKSEDPVSRSRSRSRTPDRTDRPRSRRRSPDDRRRERTKKRSTTTSPSRSETHSKNPTPARSVASRLPPHSRIMDASLQSDAQDRGERRNSLCSEGDTKEVRARSPVLGPASDEDISK